MCRRCRGEGRYGGGGGGGSDDREGDGGGGREGGGAEGGGVGCSELTKYFQKISKHFVVLSIFLSY